MIINKSSKELLGLQERTIQYGENVYPDEGYMGFSKVTVKGITKSDEYVTPGNTEMVLTTPSGGADTIGSVTVNGVKTNTLTISPSQQKQEFTPTSPSSGYDKVIVKAAPKSTIFANPQESDVVYTKNVGDYGVGNLFVKSAKLQEKTIYPTTSPQIITPDSGYYGISKVTVKGGTALKSYVNIYTGQGDYSYWDSNVLTGQFISNPTCIMVYALYDMNAEGDYYSLFSLTAYQSWGQMYVDDDYMNNAPISIADMSYTAHGNGMGFVLPIYNSNDRAIFKSQIVYCIRIFGT